MTLDEIAERLPPPLVPSAAAVAAAANADTGAPLAQVFAREVALANSLLTHVAHDMRRLELVLARHTRVSRDLEAVIDAFCNDRVPMAWRNPSLTPASTAPHCALGAWLGHQVRHAQALARWCASGEAPPSRSGSDPVWLPGLTCPASLVEATRLRAAIANTWPLAQTRIATRVQGVAASSLQVPHPALSGDSAGVLVSGVQLDQACWDVGRMGAVRGGAGGCDLPPVLLTGVGPDAAALVAPTQGHGGEAVDEWLGVPRPRRGASGGVVAIEGATSGAECVSVPVFRTLGRTGPAVMHVAIPALDPGSTGPREWLLAAVCGVLDPH